MSRVILITLLLSLLLLGCGKSDDTSSTPPQGQQISDNKADDTAIAAKLLGTWILDVPRSIEKVKTSPKAQSSDPESIASSVEKMAGKLKMQITDAEMIMLIGTREQTMGYTVASVDQQEPSVTFAINDTPDVTVVFTIIDDAYLNFISSDTDDMDYIIWKQDSN